MIAGQYAIHGGDLVQVVTIQTGMACDPHGAGWESSSVYQLHVLGTEHREWVTNPTDLTLTPACPRCGLPEGFGVCSVTGDHAVRRSA